MKKYSKKRKISFMWLEILLILVVVAALATEAFFYLYLSSFIKPEKKAVKVSPSNLLLESVNVEIKTKDGLKLSGWLLPNKKSNKVILMVHGYESNKAELLTLSSRIVTLGYSILLFDMRGCGESEGDRTYMGVKEKDDIESALTYILNDNRIKASSIAIWADNVSAYAAVLAIEKFPEVKLLMLNNIYPNPLFYLNSKISLPFSLPKEISDFFIYQNIKYLLAFKPDENDLHDILPNVKGRTLIFFQTRSASYDYVKDLYQIAPERKELVQLPRVGVDALQASDWEMYFNVIKQKLAVYFPLESGESSVVTLGN
jgi:uncharacterized protein